jgi:hypothetical protein
MGMMERIKKIDPVLQEVYMGIILFGLVCQTTAVWFLKDKAGFSLGLWIGVLLALGCTAHMWWSISRYLDFGANAPRMAARDQLIRYGVIVIVMGIVMVTKAAQPLAVFAGLMGLKVAAYIRPITHKLIRR